MRALAAANPKDEEAQVFYALALLANASPGDKEHRKQKQAADLLERLYLRFPDHPGIPHYLIHACDSQELASRGLAAARDYSKIAPSAPHALHMPSHIFTRLGLWDDSITSNLAAASAAHLQGDTGEELHAMDYLVYAYLQSGRDQQAAGVIQRLRELQVKDQSEFKAGYASTVMPIRYVVERQQWSDAEKIVGPSGPALPQVIAIAVWARGLGFARDDTHAPQRRRSGSPSRRRRAYMSHLTCRCHLRCDIRRLPQAGRPTLTAPDDPPGPNAGLLPERSRDGRASAPPQELRHDVRSRRESRGGPYGPPRAIRRCRG